MKWHLETIIPFGKHKGFTIEEVIQLEPSYVDWMIRTLEKDTFDTEVVETLWRESKKH